MTEEEKQDFQWRIIQRFDFFIATTNSKTSMLIAFNTFVLITSSQ